MGQATPTADPGREGRWELLRALGALTVDAPGENEIVFRTLGLEPWSGTDHTKVFVLDLPPYASIYLDPEGKLGGACVDQIAGVWRALGLDPPSEPDHLLSLFGLYASLGSAISECSTQVARKRVEVAARTVLSEHLHPWIFVYLAAVQTYPATEPWAELVRGVLRMELRSWPDEEGLPLMLREAPRRDLADLSPDRIYELATVPVMAGGVVTFRDLEEMGSRAGVGVRRGERRFILRSMMEQEPRETLRQLATHFHRWEGKSLGESVLIDGWWKERVKSTALLLEKAASE